MKTKIFTFFLSLALILSLAPAAFATSFTGYSEWTHTKLTKAE
jgi:hypothetical protein